MTGSLAKLFMNLELENVADEIANVRDVRSHMVLGRRVKVAFVPLEWGHNTLVVCSVRSEICLI